MLSLEYLPGQNWVVAIAIFNYGNNLNKRNFFTNLVETTLLCEPKCNTNASFRIVNTVRILIMAFTNKKVYYTILSGFFVSGAT